MVKASTIRFILSMGGLVIMLLILLSDASKTAKGIGIFLSVILIALGIIITGPLKKYFEKVTEGSGHPPSSFMDFR